MSIAVIPDPPKPPARRGRPKGSTGNGKTQNERLSRIQRRQEVSQAEIAEKRAISQAELELKAELARAELASQVYARKSAQAESIVTKYAKQESKRSPQLQIDQLPVFWVMLGLGVAVFLATAILTADGTIGAASAARFTVAEFGYILFFVFEAATLLFMLMYYILGSRVDPITGRRVPSNRWFVAMVLASIFTVMLSAYHVLDLYEYDFTQIDLYVGIGIRVIASVFFVIASKGIASVLFAKALDLNDLAKVGS